MKHTRCCPKCKGTKILHVVDVAANRDTGTSQVQPTMELAVTGKGPHQHAGELEAYACSRCGLTEVYLKSLPPVDGTYVVLLEGPPEAPYR